MLPEWRCNPSNVIDGNTARKQAELIWIRAAEPTVSFTRSIEQIRSLLIYELPSSKLDAKPKSA
jgi:hypothetical protein